MRNRIVTVDLERPARVRLGVPAELPREAIQALVDLFGRRPSVVSARIGLMEVMPEGQNSFFVYAVGIQCDGEASKLEDEAFAVLEGVPVARWPISIVPLSAQYFTPQAIVFYRREDSMGK